MNARIILPACLVFLVAGLPAAAQSVARSAADIAGYSVYRSWSEMDKATNAKYATVIRVSGDSGYTGFWFFGAEQFDVSNRYAIAMTVQFKNREVTKDDVGDIGYFDLQRSFTTSRPGRRARCLGPFITSHPMANSRRPRTSSGLPGPAAITSASRTLARTRHTGRRRQQSQGY